VKSIPAGKTPLSSCCPSRHAGIIHQVWCCAIAFVIVLAVVEISKPFSGRLRPDFLARCQPAELSNNSSGSTGGYTSTQGGNVAQATLGSVHVGQVVTDCTNPDKEAIRDGRLR
jgi:hypothetical protein